MKLWKEKQNNLLWRNREKDKQYQDQNKSQYYSFDCFGTKVVIEETNPKKNKETTMPYQNKINLLKSKNDRKL